MASRPKPSAAMVVPWVRRKSCGVARSAPSSAQIVRIAASNLPIGVPRAPAKTKPRRPVVAEFREQLLRRRRQPYAMARAILGARPADCGHRLARHLPPAVYDVFAAHVRDLAGALAGEQDHFQGCADDQSGVIEARPELWYLDSERMRSRLLVGLRATSLQGLVARMSSLTAHEKIARHCGEDLVGDDGCLDARHQRLDVGAGDARRLQLGPAR